MHALQTVGRLTHGRVQAITDRLNVVRPYGSLGRLPWQALTPIGFGTDLVQFPAHDIVGKGLMTYTEQSHAPEKLQQIANAMHTADVVISIGFGFHQQNLALLKCAASVPGRTTVATASGIDRENHQLLETQLRTLFRSSQVALSDKRGYDFMSQLRPTISAAVS